MKSRLIAQLVIASLMGTPVIVFAQANNDAHHGAPTQHESKAPAHGVARAPAAHEAVVGRPGGPIPHSDWHKGERLPAEYRDRNYVVDNWREHGLKAPPRGYQWVGVNGDYVLAAVATGIIASVLTSGH
jgi:Ni/Co efflux regulator RcnB